MAVVGKKSYPYAKQNSQPQLFLSCPRWAVPAGDASDDKFPSVVEHQVPTDTLFPLFFHCVRSGHCSADTTRQRRDAGWHIPELGTDQRRNNQS